MRMALLSTLTGLNTFAIRNWAVAAVMLLSATVNDGLARKEVKWRVNATCIIANSADNTVKQHDDIICTIVANTSDTSRRIVFTNSGNCCPFGCGDLIGIWVGVVKHGIQIGRICVQEESSRNAKWVITFRKYIFSGP